MELETRATAAEAASARPAAGLLAALVALVLALGALCAAPTAAWAASDDIASGTSGTCDWVIDADGVLTISPSNGKSGTLESYTYSSRPSWCDYGDAIASVVIKDGVRAGEQAECLFYMCVNATEIDGLGNLDVSNTTSTYFMFAYCESLQSLDVADWDVSSVTDMTSMFFDCSSLMSLDVSSWDVSSATNMGGVFNACDSLQSLDVSSWDTSNLVHMSNMFSGCYSLQSLDVSDWDVSDVEFAQSAFSACSSLVELDVSAWDVSNMLYMYSMFNGCSSLESLDLSEWDVSNVEAMQYMFEACTSLRYLDLSGWDNSSVNYSFDDYGNLSTNRSIGMFDGCTGLRTVKLGSGFSFVAMGDDGESAVACSLPTPVNAAGAEGVWMNEDTGVVYEDPEDIPSNTAATYVAVFDGVASSDFTDVQDPGKWYYDAVYGMSDLGYITGYSDGSFGVGDKMTRAQFVTIIWRIACPDEYEAYDGDAANESGLSDVAAGKYYTAAINWAVENGVVTGYSNGKFGVNDSMSFQDMCLIIARWAGAADGSYDAITFAEADDTLGEFSDGSSVSRYAEPGMTWCVQQGLVSGNTDGSLAPQSKVARERVCVVVFRAIEGGIL